MSACCWPATPGSAGCPTNGRRRAGVPQHQPGQPARPSAGGAGRQRAVLRRDAHRCGLDGLRGHPDHPGAGGVLLPAWAESRWGKRRAVAVFLGGHVVATLLTAAVITVALRYGWYPAAVRQSLDYGVSYGAQTVLAVGTLALPRRGACPGRLSSSRGRSAVPSGPGRCRTSPPSAISRRQ
ncbi:rhomboid-like protein [Streptomyces sp. PCS3-D2]|uniref:rhomboid-like protein n=1 Tax=Streptomyces sp. PCS3-D2 TaxID=1460244 RepID=UPI00351A275B